MTMTIRSLIKVLVSALVKVFILLVIFELSITDLVGDAFTTETLRTLTIGKETIKFR